MLALTSRLVGHRVIYLCWKGCYYRKLGISYSLKITLKRRQRAVIKWQDGCKMPINWSIFGGLHINEYW